MATGFIVEGFNDEKKLRQLFPDVHVAVTKGTRFKNRTWMDIEKVIGLSDEVYILTDPDEAGDVIANVLIDKYGLQRIHIEKEQCVYIDSYQNISYGVETCNDDYLLKLLTPYTKG